MDDRARFNTGLGRLEDSAFLRRLQNIQFTALLIGPLCVPLLVVGAAIKSEIMVIIFVLTWPLSWGLAIALGWIRYVARGQPHLGEFLLTFWLGVVIIVASGMYVFHREASLARQAAS